MFSHRVYVVGRVIDSDGLPAPGLAVSATFEGIGATSRCFDSKDEVTGAQGDYELCRHAHVIPENANATVRIGSLERSVSIDPHIRHASASFQLDRARDVSDVNGDRTFARAFLATGRAFALLPQSENAEGIVVNATPLTANVTVSLVRGNETLVERVVAPDEHGRYKAELAIEEVPDGTLVRARVGGDVSEEPADALFRRADVNVIRDLRLAHGPGDDAPGSSTPLGAWIALVAIAIAWCARVR